MEKVYTKPELLAPAGNFECLKAALQAGADAIYLGLDQFNARQNADNFTLESLGTACDMAHIQGKKIFLTLNIVILDKELDEVVELARQAYIAGVDAFIVQDLGLALRVRQCLPDATLHISTQMNIHNSAGIHACASLGAKRITLARELSLAQLTSLAQEAHDLGMEVESFAHGAICICYSGQCFMSAMVGGRSANRGTCAQACRMSYKLYNKAQRKPVDTPGEHLLSPKDLSTIELLDKLIMTGVDSLKIEGRMKSADYVYTVVSAYRKNLDSAFAQVGAAPSVQAEETLYTPSEEDVKSLSEVFSRGFTQGYLKRIRNDRLMSYKRPNNRGVFIGRVAKVTEADEAGSAKGKGKASKQENSRKQGSNQGKPNKSSQAKKRARYLIDIKLVEDLNKGDLLEVWSSKGNTTLKVDEIASRSESSIRLISDVCPRPNDRVFRVRNASTAFEQHDDALRLSVCGVATIVQGRPLEIAFWTNEGLRACATGSLVEAARTKELSYEDAYEHINRLGGTPFMLEELTIELDSGVGLGFSELHKVRARALELLEEALLEAYKSRRLHKQDKDLTGSVPSALSSMKSAGASSKKEETRGHSYPICALVTNPACARAAKKAGADIVYVNALNYKRKTALIAGQLSETVEQAGYPSKISYLLPVVNHDKRDGSLEARKDFDIETFIKPEKRLVAHNFGDLVRALEAGATVEAGPHLPLLNRASLELVEALGVSSVWLSPELSLAQIKDLCAHSKLSLGLFILGQSELMTCEHCLLMSEGPCDERCGTCSRRKSPHYLQDRLGYEMPIVTDMLGRSHLYNAVQLDLCHLMPELIAAGLEMFMVDTSLMNTEETFEAVSRAYRARNAACAHSKSLPKQEGKTTGLIFRGIG